MPDAAAPLRSSTTAWWVAFVLALVCVFPVAVAALSQYGDVRGNVTASCLGGQERLPGATAADVVLIEARVTAFPVGRLCVWADPDGQQITQQTGVFATMLGVLGASGCLLASVIAVWGAGAQWRRVIVSLGPIVGVLALWGIIVLSAHSSRI